MKKLILISSLLAAGTMAANAATLIAQWNDFESLSSTLGTTTLTVSNLTSSGSSVVDGVLAVSNASASTYTDRLCVDLTSTNLSGANGGFTLVLDINTFSNGVTHAIADMVGGSTKAAGAEGGFGIGRGNTGNNAWRINNQGTWQAGTAATPAGTTATPSANPGTIVFTFDSDGSMCMYVGGVLMRTDTATAKTNTTAGYSDSVAFTKLVLGGYGDHTNTAANSTYNLTKMALYSGVLATDDITSGNVYVSSIPEPSFFGLLAGTLALGLAGTRRRKRS